MGIPKRLIFGYSRYISGNILLGMGTIWLILGVVAAVFRELSSGFFLSSTLALLSGMALKSGGTSKSEPTRSEVLISTALLWFAVPLIGAAPYWLSGGMVFIDAWFESVSGFTTTGSTAIADFSQFGNVLMFWRSLSQWIGGLGVLVLLGGVLGHLGLTGRQLFSNEGASKNVKEPIAVKIREAFKTFFRVYFGLTILCGGLYVLSGMPLFEAVCNALSTLSTGGFSPNANSFIDYSPMAQWTATFFMFIAGASYATIAKIIISPISKKPLLQEIEFIVYASAVILLSLSLAVALVSFTSESFSGSVSDAIRHAFFTITSIASATGFASSNFGYWAPSAQSLVLVAMLIGGTVGSASGGIKIIRLLVVGGIVRRELFRALHPYAVLPLRLGNKLLSDDVRRSVSAFITLFAATFVCGGLIISIIENDFLLGFSASLQAISNIGPGIGDVGPLETFGILHPISKLILIGQMWAGRLELIPVFVLLVPELWKRLRN